MLKIESFPNHVRWTVSSPDRGNGIGKTLAQQLFQAAAALDTASLLPVVITAEPLPGKRGRVWIAGGDLKELATMTAPDQGRAYAQIMSEALRFLALAPQIIITAVDGAAIGGGAELALAGDIRLGTDGSTFAFKQLQVGLATGYGSARRMIDLFGLAQAQRLLYLSETIDSGEAVRLGILHKTAEDHTKLNQLIDEVLGSLNALSPEAVSAQKAMFAAAVQQGSDAARRSELDLFTAIWMNPKHASFLKSFAEKTAKK